MLREDGLYPFGLPFARFMPLNDDKTIPVPIRIIGGAGPFDFSGEANPAAIPLITKIDNGAEETVNINLSGVVSISAVTLQELVDAINLAAPTDITASIDATTTRLKLAYDESDYADIGYVQVYGAAALIARIGQGKGCKFVKTDTLKSFGEEPVVKDEEVFTTTDAKGLDTSVISDGYRKGFTANIVDTAEDWELLALLEGGDYNDGTDSNPIAYEPPTSESEKIYFYAEVYYVYYTEGENKEADIIGYVQKLCRTCKGSVGGKNHERGFADGNYVVKGTSYKDENGDLFSDMKLVKLTPVQYAALNLETV